MTIHFLAAPIGHVKHGHRILITIRSMLAIGILIVVRDQAYAPVHS